LNIHEEYDFAIASGPLQAIGIETHHLKSVDAVAYVCQRFLLR